MPRRIVVPWVEFSDEYLTFRIRKPEISVIFVAVSFRG